MRQWMPVRWAVRREFGLVGPAHLILHAFLQSRYRLAQPSAQPIPWPGIEPTAPKEIALDLVALRETLQPGAGGARPGICGGKLGAAATNIHRSIQIYQPVQGL